MYHEIPNLNFLFFHFPHSLFTHIPCSFIIFIPTTIFNFFFQFCSGFSVSFNLLALFSLFSSRLSFLSVPLVLLSSPYYEDMRYSFSLLKINLITYSWNQILTFSFFQKVEALFLKSLTIW